VGDKKREGRGREGDKNRRGGEGKGKGDAP